MIGSEIIGRDNINQNPYHLAVDQHKVLRFRQYTNIKQIFLMSLIHGKIYQKLRKIMYLSETMEIILLGL